MDVQKTLLAFAFEKAHPYIIRRPEIKDHLSRISFILVGSTATGLCTVDSDVDICLLCGQETFDVISAGTRWTSGRPTEVVLDGTQLHYYAVSTEELAQKVREQDELALYVYGNAIVIDDAAGHYRPIAEAIHDPALLSQRLERAMDMLGRRRRALRHVLNSHADPVARVELCTELIKQLLACIALYDGKEHDHRKRPYQTALLGPAGAALRPQIDGMLALLGAVCRLDDRTAAASFLERLDRCFDHISRRGAL